METYCMPCTGRGAVYSAYNIFPLLSDSNNNNMFWYFLFLFINCLVLANNVTIQQLTNRNNMRNAPKGHIFENILINIEGLLLPTRPTDNNQ